MTSQVIIQAIISGILMGLIYALIAAGLSLIFGLMEIVNFAHGDHLMIAMFSTFWFWMLFGIDPIFSIPLTIILMAFLGVFTHYFIIRKILNSTMLIQICATFGLAVTIRALAQFFFTPDFRTIKNSNHPRKVRNLRYLYWLSTIICKFCMLICIYFIIFIRN